MVQPLWKTVTVSQKVKRRITIYANSTPEYIAKESKTSVQTKTCTQIFTAALFTIAKRWKNNIHQKISGSIKCRICTQWNIMQPQKGMKYWHMLQREWTLKTLCKGKEARHKGPHTVWFRLHGMSRIRKSIETESRFVVAQGRGRGGNVEWLLNLYGISFWGEESDLKLDGGDGCTTLWRDYMSLAVNFMLCIFFNSKNKRIGNFLRAAADGCHAGCFLHKVPRSE